MQVFLMGWLVYFSQYFGRYNYAASMVAIGQKQGWDTALLGLIASIIFVTYGFGQLFTGWLGDRLNPKAMIFVGCARLRRLQPVDGTVGQPAPDAVGLGAQPGCSAR